MICDSIEEWKPVVGFKHAIEISNRGSLRKVLDGGRYLYYRQNVNGAGYPFVGLRTLDGRRINQRIHVLVAAAFIGNRPAGMCVNHKDGNKTNNLHTNLEYTSYSYNVSHALMLNERSGRAKLSTSDVVDIRNLAGSMTQKQIGEKYGIGQDQVSRILGGKHWQYVS